MNDFEERLHSSVATNTSFGVDDVAHRVAERRRRRRIVGATATTVVVLLVVGVIWATVGGDDHTPDVEAVDDPPTSVPDDGADDGEPPALGPYDEDAVGADGESGATSDLHVETSDTFGFVACGAEGEPGPPSGDRAVELEAVIEDLRSGGLHDQPFVGSSGGPQSIWGVPSIGLSARYEPTLRWIADRVDPADVCIEFPEFGLRNLPPALADVEVDVTDGVVTVRAVGCEPKGEWVVPFIRGRVDGPEAEVGIAVGRGGLAFTDDCPAPVPHEFALGEGVVSAVAATEPGTLTFDGVVPAGGTIGFTFDPVNADSATIGDDLIAQHADDPTVQFQVSDVFSDSPVAGTVGPVATDQWPVEGAGTIVVPEDVPAGTYHVRFVDTPELNGTLTVS